MMPTGFVDYGIDVPLDAQRRAAHAANLARYLSTATLGELAELVGALAAELGTVRNLPVVLDLQRVQSRLEAAAGLMEGGVGGMTAWPQIERSSRAQWRSLPADLRDEIAMKMHQGMLNAAQALLAAPQQYEAIWTVEQAGIPLVLMGVKTDLVPASIAYPSPGPCRPTRR